jgi:hypothetical protein
MRDYSYLNSKENREKNRLAILAGYKNGRKVVFKGEKRPNHAEKMKKIYVDRNWMLPMIGEENPAWMGDNAGYSALHKWLYNHKEKTGICEHCGKKPKTRTEFANLSGEYKRDINDYGELCSSCHRLFDAGRIVLGAAFL